MRRVLLAFLFSLLATGCESITPSHNIPVKTEYIDAGIQVGDTIEITLKDGEEMSFEVVSVRMDAIEGPNGDISISNIQSIVKRSWEPPGHPCATDEPVGCSIPEVVLLLSEDYKEQAAKFQPACVTHDFCYRHGNATYGATREECDTEFLADMKKSCGGIGGLDVLDLEGYGICRIAADQTHNVVRLKGGPHFRTSTSSYCEYKPESL